MVCIRSVSESDSIDAIWLFMLIDLIFRWWAKAILFFISIIAWNVNFSENVPVNGAGTESDMTPHYVSYTYTPTANGYNYRFDSNQLHSSSDIPQAKCDFSLSLSNSYSTNVGVCRDESFEILNRGSAYEEVILNGEITFSADDKYQYTIYYGYDKGGRNVTLDYFVFDRIPPSVLKSLIGWLLYYCEMLILSKKWKTIFQIHERFCERKINDSVSFSVKVKTFEPVLNLTEKNKDSVLMTLFHSKKNHALKLF